MLDANRFFVRLVTPALPKYAIQSGDQFIVFCLDVIVAFGAGKTVAFARTESAVLDAFGRSIDAMVGTVAVLRGLLGCWGQ